MTGTVEFFGEQFEVPERFDERLYLRSMTHARKANLMKAKGFADDHPDMQTINLAAGADTDRMIDQCVRLEDRDRFEDLCAEVGPTLKDYSDFVARVIEEREKVREGRPTVQPADSSVGPVTMPESSVSRLEELATERWSGRPDLMMAATASERSA
jgi:hypothetical protein